MRKTDEKFYENKMRVIPFPTKWNSPEYRLIVERMELKGRILDIGCGRGEMAYFFKDCFGIDIRQHETWHARLVQKQNYADREYSLFLKGKRIGYKRKILNCVVGDGCTLPIRSRIFEGILLNNSFEHIKDKETLVREISRVSKEGTDIVLILPTAKWKIFRFIELLKNILRIFTGYPFVNDWLVHSRDVYGYNFVREFLDFSNWEQILSKYFEIRKKESFREGFSIMYTCRRDRKNQ